MFPYFSTPNKEFVSVILYSLDPNDNLKLRVF